MNAKKVVLGVLDTAAKAALVIIIAVIIIRLSRTGYEYGYQIFNQKPVSTGTGRTATVTISDGDSAGEIADKLLNVGLITDKTLFKLQEKFSEYSGMEVAGTYELSTSMTPEEMIQVMAAGNAAVIEASLHEGEEGDVESSSEESSSD